VLSIELQNNYDAGTVMGKHGNMIRIFDWNRHV